ncbi:hypothetical protein AYM40_37640 (plasmid) [Paraburkholderia phytofirmans OLGA172]|uniref:DUF4391 domain-containing protein n=1 Tax=Paraburkholderia phytofirmans OLGA172 TaxID=1417228 RepID=A0A167WRM7_9BURK|nr:DUF4391 domain-containing protein [Paraburkholderia phytofirmans]ANB78082.1 hypothetical protein AYM40_37640 [Paraburkholderia phytofirmans OLGA172]
MTALGVSPLSSPFTSRDLIAALDLPGAALVNQRVPKKLLVENGSPTAADKKLIQDGIEEITWVAALKPANIGIPEFRDELRAYLELAVLCITLREQAKTSRIAELVHRAIPYPLVLILEDGPDVLMSLAHIRWAQREADKTVLDDGRAEVRFSDHVTGDTVSLMAFLEGLPLSRQPRADLYALYQGWIDTTTALQAAAITGRFVASTSPEHAAAWRAALQRCREIDSQVANLRLGAAKEKQMARQVAINLEIKRLEQERASAVSQLNEDNS